LPGELPGRTGVLHVAGCTAYEIGERRRPPGRPGRRRRVAA
jgi:hypothetical protein